MRQLLLLSGDIHEAPDFSARLLNTIWHPWTNNMIDISCVSATWNLIIALFQSAWFKTEHEPEMYVLRKSVIKFR